MDFGVHLAPVTEKRVKVKILETCPGTMPVSSVFVNLLRVFLYVLSVSSLDDIGDRVSTRTSLAKQNMIVIDLDMLMTCAYVFTFS